MTGDPQTSQTGNGSTPPVSSDTGGGAGSEIPAHYHKWVHKTLKVNPLDYGRQPNQPGDAKADQPDGGGSPDPAEPSSGAPPPAAVDATSPPSAEASAKDKYKGALVSKVTISIARHRVGFQTPFGMMLGDVDTDLLPGEYTLQPDVPHQKWIITGPAVKSGLRFDVTLKDADPWTLTYPNTLPLSVDAGSDTEPKTAGDIQDAATGKPKDPLWLYEGMPLQEPVSGIDDFEDVRYDLDYRSEKGNLSKFLTVSYRDSSHKDIAIDSVNKDTPRLWAAKQEALKVMDEYNTLFILGSFPTVFFLITINPFVAPIEGGPPPRYSATRRSVPKSAPAGETEQPEGAVPKADEPGAVATTNEPLKPGVGMDMYIEAAKRMKSTPPGARVERFKAYVEEIKISTKGQWSAQVSTLSDGGTMFSGEGGEALVFDPKGNMFRGSTSNVGGADAQFSIGEGGRLTPNYRNLRPR